MKGFLYVLTDGVNTKIGVTKNLADRLKAYSTHNASFRLVRDFSLDMPEARRAENAIKALFRDRLSGDAKEWFSVPSQVVEECAAAILSVKGVKHGVQEGSPAFHEVNMPDRFWELRGSEIEYHKLDAADRNTKRKGDHEKARLEMSELFGKCFGLGIPAHKLADYQIARKTTMDVDFDNCTGLMSILVQRDAGPKLVNAGRLLRSTNKRMPHDDHIKRYYHMLRLNSGHYVAVNTSYVSMPYINTDEDIRGISFADSVEAAGILGWHCIPHNEWSWYYPEKSGLILYLPKTPVSALLRAWDTSFRKWIIENGALLKTCAFHEPDVLHKTIEDTIRDDAFPLHVKNVESLYDEYLGPFLCHDERHFMWRAYSMLFHMWEGGQDLCTPAKNILDTSALLVQPIP